MSLILKILHLFDNKKKREYVSEATQFMQNFDHKNPKRSASQKEEANKHRNIYNRKPDSIL